MINLLKQLEKHTKIVADTGEVDIIKQLKPYEVTTNPSLILKTIKKENNNLLIDILKEEKNFFNKYNNEKDFFSHIIILLNVELGSQILNYIPGRISIEINPFLSFDIENSINEAKKIISLYEQKGINKNRILIKLATTWEGIKAAEILEKENINCNMTLIFSLIQAIKCAEAKVTLISPFVGRIYDWYKQKEKKEYIGSEDPGVIFVKSIYDYYKKFDYKTQIMGASFRNIQQIIELSGCDLLTISPSLINELSSNYNNLNIKLSPEKSKLKHILPLKINEKEYSFLMNQDIMASEKLEEGISLFKKDYEELMSIITEYFYKI